MEKCRFLSAAFAGTFFYVLITLFCGRDGIFAYNQQAQQKDMLEVATKKIAKIKESLLMEQTALLNDTDVIGALAKKLGYVAPGDKIVIINGLYFSENYDYDPGIPLKAEEPEYLPEWFGKSVGLIVFLVVYFYSISVDIKKGVFKKKKRDGVFLEGIPVYDVPQV